MAFHEQVLEGDGARFVRWASIDALNDLNEVSPERLRSPGIRRALKSALEAEEDSISSRKKTLERLLASIR